MEQQAPGEVGTTEKSAEVLTPTTQRILSRDFADWLHQCTEADLLAAYDRVSGSALPLRNKGVRYMNRVGKEEALAADRVVRDIRQKRFKRFPADLHIEYVLQDVMRYAREALTVLMIKESGTFTRDKPTDDEMKGMNNFIALFGYVAE